MSDTANLLPFLVTEDSGVAAANIVPVYVTVDSGVAAVNLIPIAVVTSGGAENIVPVYVTTDSEAPAQNAVPFYVSGLDPLLIISVDICHCWLDIVTHTVSCTVDTDVPVSGVLEYAPSSGGYLGGGELAGSPGINLSYSAVDLLSEDGWRWTVTLTAPGYRTLVITDVLVSW